MKSLYSICTHALFNHPELDLDYPIEFYVIADDEPQAIQLWLDKVEETEGLRLTLGTEISVNELHRTKWPYRIILVTDLSYDLAELGDILVPGVLPWETVTTKYFKVLSPEE